MTAENTDQAVNVHLSLVRNYTACPKMLFDKDSIIKWHMDINADLSESPLFVHRDRMYKQWGRISLYICNV